MNAAQWAALQASFHSGSTVASTSLARWIGKPSVVEIDSLDRLPLEEATGLLAEEEVLCFCSAQMSGLLTGEMILAFDDMSGMALADMLLDQPLGTTSEWDEMATSAALETANILCCAYLNSLSRVFPSSAQGLLPSPPEFNRDFAESLLEFALMGQAVASDRIIVARTRFEIDGTPVHWTLLFVPDADSMARLPQLLPRGETT
jgi:chemotaxis protein CheC